MGQLNYYVDVDDVLAETTRALARLANARFGKAAVFEKMTVFDLSISLDLDADELPVFMTAAHEPNFLLGLEPIQGARDTLEAWSNRGIKISVVTGRPPECWEPTQQWLEMQGFPFDELEFVDKYARFNDPRAITPKDLVGRGYHAVIEDADSMADYLALHTEAQVLLFDRPWNRKSAAETNGAQRVHDWAEIRRSIPSPG